MKSDRKPKTVKLKKAKVDKADPTIFDIIDGKAPLPEPIGVRNTRWQKRVITGWRGGRRKR